MKTTDQALDELMNFIASPAFNKFEGDNMDRQVEQVTKLCNAVNEALEEERRVKNGLLQ